MTRRGFVSACIPVHNGEKYVRETIASLLSQDYEDYEVVVIDNASTDSTPKIIDSFGDGRLRTVHFDELAPHQKNWSRAFDVARGDFISICHADDTYEPGFISSSAGFLGRKESSCAVFTGANLISARGDKIGEINRPQSLPAELDAPTLLRFCVDEGYFPLVCPTFMVRNEAAKKCGRFDSSMKFAFDMDYYLRLFDYGNLGFIGERLVNYRQHPLQGSVNLNYTTDTQAEFFALLGRELSKRSISLTQEQRGRLDAYRRWGGIVDALSHAKTGNADAAMRKTRESLRLSDCATDFPSPRFLLRGAFSSAFLASQYLHLGKAFADAVFWYKRRKRS